MPIKFQALCPDVITLFEPIVIKLEHESESLGGLLNHRLLGPFPEALI